MGLDLYCRQSRYQSTNGDISDLIYLYQCIETLRLTRDLYLLGGSLYVRLNVYGYRQLGLTLPARVEAH